MADDITDVYIATEAGDAGWQSLSALAAEQVDAKLPIESVDGTVKLDSPSANTFTVSTGGSEQVKVDANGRLLLTSGSKYIGLEDLNNYLQFSNPNYGNDSLLVRCANKDVVVVDGINENVRILNSYSLVVTGQIQTDKITSEDGASNDASIDLGANFTVSTAGVDNRLAVNGRGMVGVGNAGTNSICLYINSVPTNAKGLSGITCTPEILTADAEEVSAVRTQANLGAAVAADYFNHFITGSSAGTGTAATMNGVRIIDTSLTGTTKNVAFSTNLPADSEKNFSIETGTAPSVFAGQVQTDTITSKDAAAGGASIQLGAELTFSTGGEERLTVDAAGAIIQTADMVSNGIGIKQTLEADDGSVSNLFGNYVAFSSQQTGGLHDGGWIGYYVHTVSTTQSVKEVRGLGVNDQGNAIVSASAFHSAINARAGKERYAVNAVGSAPSYFGGQVQTDTITSKDAASNDASIELGANLIAGAGTGGSFIVQTNNTGKFFVDSNGYATFKPLNVERAVVDGEGLKIKQLKGADDTYGKDVSRIQLRNTDGNDSALTIISYGSGIDELQTFSGVGPNGGGVIGRTDHPFAIGTEFNQPLYLSSNNLKQVEITKDDVTFTNNIKTPSVSGLADTNASIQLGAELLTSNHNPTQPNSIATKQTVDDKIWVGTTAEYNALATKNPTTLYCLTD